MAETGEKFEILLKILQNLNKNDLKSLKNSIKNIQQLKFPQNLKNFSLRNLKSNSQPHNSQILALLHQIID